MQIGKYKISYLETGTLGLDGGAMFGVIPKPLWERTNPSDEKNRITLAARCMLLESDTKKILVDTGAGQSWDEKFSKIYRMEFGNTLIKSLAAKGLTSDDITDVILTHLHFDHVGGASVIDEDGKSRPTFPNAKYYIQKKQYEWALNPSMRDKASYFPNRYVPLYEEGLLKLVEGDTRFDDEIEMLVTNGHTDSHQMVKVSDGNETILYCADLIPTAGHVPLPYIMGYDLRPLETLAEKMKYLTKAVEENWMLFFEHDPENIGVTVKQTDKGFVVDQRFDKI
jgi:glyoxylase-like metal-dependent hydrolase (beta-lactamase superfamily II)